jgi:hydroxyethylthiazole kinase-like uncharacterized protein yjeF
VYLVRSREMRALDAKAVEMGIPAAILMENAGRAVADEVERLLPLKGTVAVLAGPGQNGGDGLCAARHLAARGFPVRVLLLGNPAKMPREARDNLAMLENYTVDLIEVADQNLALREALARMADARVVIDALLGTGQAGDARPPMDEAVRWANEAGAPIIACDIPTGVDADTGSVFNPVINATVTVTMGLPKLGLYVYPGAAHAGRIVVESLGLPPELLSGPFDMLLYGVEDARSVMPARSKDHHKGLSGHVLVVAGSKGMAGAAVLASRAALRAGAGTVTLLCPGDIYEVCASMSPEVMVLPCGSGKVCTPSSESVDLIRSFLVKSECVALGPGLGRGESQAEFLAQCLPLISAAGVPCVLDADALHALNALGGLSYLGSLAGKFILTPHPGELATLMGVDVPVLQRDRPRMAKEAALRGKSVVCLKGAGTCVANSVGSVTVNTTGDPAMAAAGSGDVLTGVVAALVAQGLPLYEAARLGVFWHGLSGEIARQRSGSYGVLAGEICDCLPGARKAIVGGERPA